MKSSDEISLSDAGQKGKTVGQREMIEARRLRRCSVLGTQIPLLRGAEE